MNTPYSHAYIRYMDDQDRIQNNFVSLMMAAASWSVLFNSVLQTTGKAEPRQTRGRKP
jgi:hypothetical protein